MGGENIIAVDIGTTSTKALVVDGAGRVLASRSAGYPLLTPKPGYAEQNPDTIYEAVLACIERVMKEGGFGPDDILCVSFSSASHSLILLDEADRPLTASITWADQRSTVQAERLNRDGSGLQIYRRTGTPIHPMAPIVKLLWFKEDAPELWQRARRFVGIKDYVFLRLFGEAVTDFSMASGTGLFNLEKLDYDSEVLDRLEIDGESLPRLAPVTHAITGLSPSMAARLGLHQETPFVLGAQDGVLANVGIGAMGEGSFAVTIGTSSAVRTGVRQPVLDAEGRLFCYALTPDDWVVGGPSNNGAMAVQWMASRLYPGRSLDEVLPLVADIPPGCDGLLFAPLLAGERAPHWDPQAKGVMLGLRLSHREPHLLRAAMEGVLFQVASIAEQIRQAGLPIREIRASGGFARSPLWCQMLADVLHTPVCVPPSVESSALGAARLARQALAGAGVPVWRDQSQNVLPPDTVAYEPNPVHAAQYAELLPLYQKLYESTGQLMRDLDAVCKQ